MINLGGTVQGPRHVKGEETVHIEYVYLLRFRSWYVGRGRNPSNSRIFVIEHRPASEIVDPFK